MQICILQIKYNINYIMKNNSNATSNMFIWVILFWYNEVSISFALLANLPNKDLYITTAILLFLATLLFSIVLGNLFLIYLMNAAVILAYIVLVFEESLWREIWSPSSTSHLGLHHYCQKQTHLRLLDPLLFFNLYYINHIIL